MPDRSFCWEWIVQRHYGGRVETMECEDDKLDAYLMELLQDPDKAHPDMKGSTLTRLRLYRRKLDMEVSHRTKPEQVVDFIRRR